MPELPEVETVVRDLRRGGLVGRTIRTAAIPWPRTVSGLAPNRFRRLVSGRRVLAVARRAKYVVLTLSGGLTALVHLRMSGRLALTPAKGACDDPHLRLRLDLDDGRRLLFCDPRKFGRWTLTRDPAAVLRRIGPEPLSAAFSPSRLASGLARHRRMLKPLLLDQTFVAGVGNIYADEALWHARLHPRRLSHTLTRAEAESLRLAIRSVLRQAIRMNGTSLGHGRANFRGPGGKGGRNQNLLRVFRRTGCPCPRCGTPIARTAVAQRGTHLCPACQPAP